MYFPRVLIFGQPFNKRHGGGITLTNLFKGWDKDKIAVAATGHVMKNVTTDVCETFYQLGSREYIWRFPFNLVQRRFPSGLKSFKPDVIQITDKKKTDLRYSFVNLVFYPILEWLGILHNSASIRMSDHFREWLEEFDPEVLYLQVATFDTILFAHTLLDHLKIPAVIHMMDDWPSTISNRGLFRKYWKRRIDREFIRLLDRMGLFLCISDAMSDEYRKRYNKEFIPFHNPVEVDFWKRHTKTSYNLGDDHVKVLYSGRIGRGITNSLLELSDAVERINTSGIPVKLYIQSPSEKSGLLTRLVEHRNVIINPVAAYNDLPAIYSEADILVIVNDFDEKSINFLRYSMPTKASEFLISGTPVLIYSHRDTAISKFFSENKCGFCVSEHDINKLADALEHLINNEQFRGELGSNATKLAEELFDSRKVRIKFQYYINNLVEPNEKL
jgi:glycosyltransferase involved in cell wall biosynthesis